MITVWKLDKEARLANDENFAVHQMNDINYSEPVSNSLLPYLQALLVPNFILMVLFLELEQQTGLWSLFCPLQPYNNVVSYYQYSILNTPSWIAEKLF